MISRLAASASGASGAQRLPGGDRRRRVVPERLERRRLGRRHGREVQRGDDAEAPAAGTPQRPEQVGLLVLVAAHLAPVGQDDLGRAQRVGGQPMEAAEDPEPAAEGEPGDADGRAAPARDRHAVRVERVVDVAEQRARADRRPPVGNRHPVEAARRRSARRPSTSGRRSSGRRCAPRRAGPWTAANSKAAATSCGVRQATTASGWMSLKRASAGRIPRIKRKRREGSRLRSPPIDLPKLLDPSGRRAFRPQASLSAATTFASGTNLGRRPREFKSG